MSDNEKFSDEEIVKKVRSYDRESYAVIVKRYQNKLMRYATYLVADEQKAADIVQGAFIKAFINLNGFNTNKKFSSWIYRIVHNEAMNAVKKYRREIPLDPESDALGSQNVEEEFDRNEIVKQAHVCLDQMPIIYSEPLALYYLDEKSYEEISDILRIPMGTVATRINRAKLLMKHICQNKS